MTSLKVNGWPSPPLTLCMTVKQLKRPLSLSEHSYPRETVEVNGRRLRLCQEDRGSQVSFFVKQSVVGEDHGIVHHCTVRAFFLALLGATWAILTTISRARLLVIVAAVFVIT